ncbi:hypothetical protein [Streptomyces narbonensis]|uniref:hypothetical protein n=1 Tax=Streptomyces narbonensis TaxID=67333 RepID=UPI0033FE4212
MAAIDLVVNAAVENVKKSGVIESGTLLGTLTSIGAGGTLQVERGSDVYPRVRLLSGYDAPAVGDLVQILKTSGGWVCLGRLMTRNPSAWTPLTLASGWTNFGGAYPVCGYRVNSEGFVRLRGLADHAGIAGPATVLTLPAEIRPSAKSRFTTEVASGLFAALDVNTNGTVTINDFTGNASWAALDVAMYYLN